MVASVADRAVHSVLAVFAQLPVADHVRRYQLMTIRANLSGRYSCKKCHGCNNDKILPKTHKSSFINYESLLGIKLVDTILLFSCRERPRKIRLPPFSFYSYKIVGF